MDISISTGQGFDPAAHSRFRVLCVSGRGAFCNYVTHNVWSPIIWEAGKRLRKGFVSCHYAALDFDEGWRISDAVRWVGTKGISAIIGTSKSHQIQKGAKPPCDRFRLIFPFHEPITDRRDYEWNMERLILETGADKACSDAARYFFPCKEIVFKNQGIGASWFKAPEAKDATPADRAALRESYKTMLEDGFPGWVHSLINHGVEARHKACFRLGATLIWTGMPEEQIVAMILKGPLGAIGQADVARAVANGVRKTREEAEEDARAAACGGGSAPVF